MSELGVGLTGVPPTARESALARIAAVCEQYRAGGVADPAAAWL